VEINMTHRRHPLVLTRPRRLLFECLEQRQMLSTVAYKEWEPRVINAATTEPVTLTAIMSGSPTTVQIQTMGGAILPLTQIATDTYQIALAPSTVLANYQTSTGHTTFGYLDTYDGTVRSERLNLSVNVRDATMPDVAVQSMSATAQASTHVANLRWDDLWTSGGAPLAAVQQFYSLFPDNYDFLSVISQVQVTANRFYMGLRNDTQGIGLSVYDNGAAWGSAHRLQGIVNYPLDTYYDAGESASSHELGHRWINFLDQAALALGTPHWPMSDFARGLMGRSLAGGAGGEFPYTFVDQGDGTYLVQAATLTKEFNDLELYLMGLAAPESVTAGRVFLNQSQDPQLHVGGVLQGPVEIVGIDQIVAADGPRVPAYADAQREFNMATLVLSDGRLLTADEMAFFDYMAARGEARTPLPYVSGLVGGMTKPFYVATRGAGTLLTRVLDAPGITVDPVAGLTTTEAGGTAVFTVRLNSQPTAEVTIGLSSSDQSEGTVSPASLTFTPANALVPQTVTVRGVADELADGDIAYTIVTAPAVSSDPLYQGRNSADVSLTNLNVSPTDFGDAPLPYPVTLARGGARHLATGPQLGATRDAETDGQPSADATGDATDEDGVTFGTLMLGQLDAQVTVNVQNALSGAKLDAWIDWDGDGSWGGVGEHIADSVAVVNGANLLEIDLPSWGRAGTTYARFRLSTAGGLGVGGLAVDGEVEDYVVPLLSPRRTLRTFGAEQTVSTATDGAVRTVAADVDQDGDMDLLFAANASDQVGWFENDGQQGFTMHVLTTAMDAPFSVAAADLDGDGDLDVLATSNNSGGRLEWLENDGQQAFQEHVIVASMYFAVRPADVDGDGDLDLVASRSSTLEWLENNGSQTFTPHTVFAASDLMYGVFAADVDRDGDLDLLSASRNDRLAWHENNGQQSFTTHTVFSPGTGSNSVFAVDMDGDHDLDIVSGRLTDSTVAWFENDGQQAFTQRIISTAASSAQDVFAADLDGDGDQDVLSASWGDSKIAWYENSGSQAFTERILTRAASGAKSVSAADLDADGDLDVLYASLTDDTVAWFAGQNPAAPTAITLAPTTVAENLAAGTIVGGFVTTDLDSGDSFTYTLTAGVGGYDNARFHIAGSQLLTAERFDFETKSTYAVRVRTTDQYGLWFEQPFTVTVTDVNEPPTLADVPTEATIPELRVYTFDANASDPDRPAQTLTFSLASAPAGANINAASGVFTWTPLETQGPGDYTFTVCVSDGTSSAEQAVTLHVTEVTEASLDADGNGTADALTDGILILRYLFAPTGAWNYTDAVGVNATRTTREAIRGYLDAGRNGVLDADGNGTPDALTDGILILRYLFAPTGSWNYLDAVGVGATRTSREAIRTFLDQYQSGVASAPLMAAMTIDGPGPKSEAVSSSLATDVMSPRTPVIAEGPTAQIAIDPVTTTPRPVPRIVRTEVAAFTSAEPTPTPTDNGSTAALRAVDTALQLWRPQSPSDTHVPWPFTLAGLAPRATSDTDDPFGEEESLDGLLDRCVVRDLLQPCL
jgi:hypothetical protein